jgi:hypothetical protein
MAKIGGQSEKQLVHAGHIALSYEGTIISALNRIVKSYKNRIFLSA